MKYDILIENGYVLDGSGNPWFKANIGVVDDRIVSIGSLKGAQAERKVNANGHIVAPGFIDIHSHSDIPLLIDPRVESKIYQGVTLEVVGNCGNSAAPMNAAVKSYREKYARSTVPEGFVYDWITMKDYLDRVDKQGVSFNVASWVGHGTVRQCVLGYEDRKPTDTEQRKMRKLVDDAMNYGAFGMSTGLIYPPSVYGNTDEIVDLVKVVAKHRGVYASHIRGEEKETLLPAVKEAIEIGERGGAPVQIAHFKASGKSAWGLTTTTLKMVEDARNRGVDVAFDQYPYTASSTGLGAVLPHWAHEGGAAKLLERLKDKATRKKMLADLQLDREWANIMIIFAKNHPEYNGKRITEIAELENKTPGDAALDLLLKEETQVPTVMFGIGEEDIARVMQSPYGMIGSDGSAISPNGILGKGKPHPRYYGTFPRVLGHYSRELKIIPLQEAIRKMTSAPAQRLGLKDLGLLRENFKACITIFNPETVKDEATFTEPHKFASGIPYVIVNGVFVVDKGKHTGKLPGKTLRKIEV
ncbi:MAG: D-aminoacylase [Candidatus Bathyarchaeota archaeon]|nr:D-aminoacylase [Candidatus Bathyarchaeota archaeon]